MLLLPSEMAHTVCGVCFSLNKSTSYLSLCLCLNSFCVESSRSRVSLSPETRYARSQLKCVQLPVQVLAGFKSQPSPNLGWTVSEIGGEILLSWSDHTTSNYYLKLGSTLDGGHLSKKHNQAKDWEKAEFITCSEKNTRVFSKIVSSWTAMLTYSWRGLGGR